MSAKGAGRSCLDTREAIKPMTPRLPRGRLDHWQVQTQQARNTPRAIGTGHTVRVPVSAESRCIPRGRGRGMGFSFLSKRPASCKCSCFCTCRQQTRFPPASPGRITAFSCFCSSFFSDMRILGNVMPKSHWRRTPQCHMLHVGAVRKVSCMADINRPRGAHGRIGPRSKPATQLVLLHDLDPPMAYLG